MLGRGAVNLHADIVLAAAFFTLVCYVLDFEANLLTVLLAPVDKFALVVPLGVCHSIDIKMDADDLKDALRKLVEALDENGKEKNDG